jgi:hypothetical protein
MDLYFEIIGRFLVGAEEWVGSFIVVGRTSLGMTFGASLTGCI